MSSSRRRRNQWLKKVNKESVYYHSRYPEVYAICIKDKSDIEKDPRYPKYNKLWYEGIFKQGKQIIRTKTYTFHHEGVFIGRVILSGTPKQFEIGREYPMNTEDWIRIT